ncbi:MAG: hypothetical protein FWD69_09650 [Polyangiaceae bacterium]|nr:hypothetical protein [Polyangiaceae bacterium]
MTGKPETTHILEIETGVGEPAFTLLCVGRELSPMSVGKKGMWRVDSTHMLDVHVFLYFNGNTLFVQSAKDAAPAMVDGERIGKAWTELCAPCKIEFGGARLRYRALAGSGNTAPLLPRPTPAPPPQPPPTPAPPPQPPPGGTAPMERPFAPGAFIVATDKDNEATRIAPIEASGHAHRPQGHLRAQSPRPAAGRPVEEDLEDDITAKRKGAPHVARPHYDGPELTPTRALVQTPPDGSGYPNPPAPGYPGASNPYAATRLLPVQPIQPRKATGGMQGQLRPSTPGNGPAPAQRESNSGAAGEKKHFTADLRTKWNALPSIKKALYILFPFVLFASIYILLPDDPPPPRKQLTSTPNSTARAVNTDPSTPTPPVATAPPVIPTPGVSAWPEGVPCPPPNWPPGTPLPCIPNGGGVVLTPPPPAAFAGPSDAGAPKESRTAKAKDASIDTKTASSKTLERQAVDAFAAGDFALAAEHYTELAKSDPGNPAFAEAARIARMRVDAGAP